MKHERSQMWNPIRGCSAVSEGCHFCRSARAAGRFASKDFAGYIDRESEGDERWLWTGKVSLIQRKLHYPLTVQTPQSFDVGPMSDLFHPDLCDEDIALIWVVMACCLPMHREALFRSRPAAHTFHVLTKRPERMGNWLEKWADPGWRRELIDHVREKIPALARRSEDFLEGLPDVLPNVWLGVSIEDQIAAVQRLPYLMRCPAAYRFVVYEPALGEVELSRWLFDREWVIHELMAGPMRLTREDAEEATPPTLDLVIAGGEGSYSESRPAEAEWFYRVADQAREANVPFQLRQLGYVLARKFTCDHPWGGDPEDWPPSFRDRLAGQNLIDGEMFGHEEEG